MSKFNLLIFYLFSITRIFDTISTYFSNDGNLTKEMNPIVKYLHLGWFGLIFSTFFFIIIAYFLLLIQTDKYYEQVEKKYYSKTNGFKNYISLIYYDKDITFLEFLFSKKIRINVLKNSLIHIFFITIIICGVIISINNILIGLNLNNLFSYQNKFYQNYLTTFLTLIVFIFVSIKYHNNRYKKFNLK